MQCSVASSYPRVCGNGEKGKRWGVVVAMATTTVSHHYAPNSNYTLNWFTFIY